MLSVLLSVSILTSILDCAPDIEESSIADFASHADAMVPHIQTDVHIPKTEDFSTKVEFLGQFVQGSDQFSCHLTNKFDEASGSCFGFLRLALVDHKTLSLMKSRPKVTDLHQISPLWIENERDVLSYLATRLKAYREQFTTNLDQDRIQLDFLHEMGKVEDERYLTLLKRVRARELLGYWIEVSEIVEEIVAMLHGEAPQLAHFTGREAFIKWLRVKADDNIEFAELLESYFLTQKGFYTMLEEELSYLAEKKFKLSMATRAGKPNKLDVQKKADLKPTMPKSSHRIAHAAVSARVSARVAQHQAQSNDGKHRLRRRLR